MLKLKKAPSSVPLLSISSASWSASPSEFNLGGVPKAAFGFTIGASGINTGILFRPSKNSESLQHVKMVVTSPFWTIEKDVLNI